MFNRRTLLASAALAGGGALAGLVEAAGKPSLPLLFNDIERRAFNFFWETANRANGLVPDRWPSSSAAGIASVGYALAAYPIGVTRGWIKREDARDLTLTTLRFFDAAPTGDDRQGMIGHRGFFYRYLDLASGLRFRDSELSSGDSSLLFLGMLFAAGWYDRPDPREAEIRRLAASIVDRADWPWFQRGLPDVARAWDPVRGFAEAGWSGYNGAMMVYLLGLGSTRRPLPDEAWSAWTQPYPRFWRGEGAARHLGCGPLIGHQLSQLWIDFRGIHDVVMRGAGFDYHENSRRAVAAQRLYASANPLRWDGYGKNVWGLSTCDGPGDFQLPFKGETRTFHGHGARGAIGQPEERDDGTLAPAAALGSVAFTPELAIPATRALRGLPRLYGRYGFVDGFNPSFAYTDQSVITGSVDKRSGWVAKDVRGVGQGIVLTAIANARDGMIWKTMRDALAIRRGLERAGFTNGYLAS